MGMLESSAHRIQDKLNQNIIVNKVIYEELLFLSR
jgi:hypothetical protein